MIATASARAEPKLRFDGVSKHFSIRAEDGAGPRQFTALQDIELSVAAGEFFVLVGPSGCGKSTLLELAAGLSIPSTGAIYQDGQRIAGPSLARGIVFQQYALFPWRTARANIEFGLEAKGLGRAERRERAEHFLALVGLSDFAGRYPHELSGGMKQRIAIARSLSYDPEILLMDEPFAALDAQTRESLQEELLRIWRATGKTIVFITHSIDEAVYLSQRVAVMASHPGRIIEFVDIPLGDARTDEDIRAHPLFVELRHHIWELFRRPAGHG